LDFLTVLSGEFADTGFLNAGTHNPAVFDMNAAFGLV
jgi:hypothetical protein